MAIGSVGFGTFRRPFSASRSQSLRPQISVSRVALRRELAPRDRKWPPAANVSAKRARLQALAKRPGDTMQAFLRYTPNRRAPRLSRRLRFGDRLALGPRRSANERPKRRPAREWRAERDAAERLRHTQPELSSLATFARPRAPEPLPLAPPGAAKSIAMKCQCSSALVAQGVLAVASLASQRLADVRPPYGQTRPLSLFFVTIAASGDRKSTADNEALIPVRMHERNLKQEYEAAHGAWQSLDIPRGLLNIGRSRTTGA